MTEPTHYQLGMYESKEVRDAVLKTPMERGVAQAFDTLEEILPTLEA